MKKSFLHANSEHLNVSFLALRSRPHTFPAPSELIIIFTKMIMTGAMSVVAPGSPIQLLLATFVMMTFTLTTLKLGPYRNRIDDRMSFLVSLVSSGNTLAGFVLIMDKEYSPPNFSPGMIEGLLLFVNIGLLTLLVMVLMKWGCWEKFKKTSCAKKGPCSCATVSSKGRARGGASGSPPLVGRRGVSSSKVVPRHQEVRSWEPARGST